MSYTKATHGKGAPPATLTTHTRIAKQMWLHAHAVVSLFLRTSMLQVNGGARPRSFASTEIWVVYVSQQKSHRAMETQRVGPLSSSYMHSFRIAAQEQGRREKEGISTYIRIYRDGR